MVMPMKATVYKRPEQGSALIVSLIMLLLISLIAIAGMEDSILQERMARNMEDRGMAFENAERALRAGEQFLAAPSSSTFSGNALLNPTPPDDWATGTGGNAVAVSLPSDSRAAGNPEYYVGPVQCADMAMGGCPVEIFRVTARGLGGEQSTEVVLRSNFARLQE
jgi:type IV pilus assembly protein PilX